jgi:hypothetical protein
MATAEFADCRQISGMTSTATIILLITMLLAQSKYIFF